MANSEYYSPYTGAEVDSAVAIASKIGSGTLVTSNNTLQISATAGAYVNGSKLATEQYVSGAIAAASGGGALLSGVLRSGVAIDTTVTEEDLAANLRLSAGIMSLEVTSGGELNTPEIEETEILVKDNSIELYAQGESGGIIVSGANISLVGDATLNGRPIVWLPTTHTDVGTTNATIDVLNGSASYIYTQPLTSIEIGNVTNTADNIYVRFVLKPFGSVTLPTDIAVYGGGSSWDYGQYLLQVMAGAVIVHSTGGDKPLDGVAGVFVKSDSVVVSGAMSVSDAVVGPGEVQNIYPFGEAIKTVVNSGGSLSLYGLAGRVSDVTVASGAVFNISEPENDFEPKDFSIIAGSSTNIAEGSLQYGDVPFTGHASGGVFTGLSGTYRLGIGAGVSALSPQIGNFDTQKARIYAFSGAYVSGASIGISGDIDVYPGGVVSDTTLGGYSGERYQCELTVWGGTAYNAIVSSNAYLNVLSGGQMLGTASVLSGGSMRIRVAPAYAENIHLKQGARFSACQNASIGELHLSSGGSAHASGGTIINELIVSGGTMWLKNASATTITLEPYPKAAGRPTILASGAYIGSLTVSTYGAVTLYSGTTVTNLQQQGGYVIARNALISGGYIAGSDFQVSSGTTAVDVVAVVGEAVTPKKKILIPNGGVVSQLTVEDTGGGTTSGISNITSQYGVVSVLAGGRLFDTEFTNIVVSNGGLVDGLIPKRVYLASGGGLAFAGSLHIYSGGTALNVVSSAGYTIVKEPGCNYNGQIIN